MNILTPSPIVTRFITEEIILLSSNPLPPSHVTSLMDDPSVIVMGKLIFFVSVVLEKIQNLKCI
jgi:hypothetical protein